MSLLGMRLKAGTIAVLAILGPGHLSAVESLSSVSNKSFAPLSDVAVYRRCHGQFTRSYLSPADPVVTQIKTGKKDPIQACMDLIKSARLNADGNTKIDVSSSVAASVIETFHALHTSFFANRNFNDSAGGRSPNTADLTDPSTPALYYTRALFHPSGKLRDVVTVSTEVEAVRTDMDPVAGAVSGYPKASWKANRPAEPWDVRLAPRGALLGVRDAVPLIMPAPAVLSVAFNALNDKGASVRHVVDLKNINYHNHMGGGILGSQSFMTANLGESATGYIASGAEKVQRKYSQAILRDLLCRDLPAVRMMDAAPYVDPKSAVSFRLSGGCVQCHASIDRMAGVVRNVAYTITASGDINRDNPSAVVWYRFPAVMPAESAWIKEPDPYYRFRNPQGILYYRSYNGQLINRRVANVGAMGSALSEGEDLYVCAAKRYYEYMTGISVNLRDLEDPMNPASLSADDAFHRAIVVDLGLKLKGHQRLETLIEDILRLPLYRMSDYGISRRGE